MGRYFLNLVFFLELMWRQFTIVGHTLFLVVVATLQFRRCWHTSAWNAEGQCVDVVLAVDLSWTVAVRSNMLKWGRSAKIAMMIQIDGERV